MPRAPTLADPAQREAFRVWLNDERTRAGCTKTALASALGHDSIQHVNKILNGDTFPMPETLRTICKKLGISWPAAFAMAGYYGHLLQAFADLTALGSSWLDEDDHNARNIPEFGVIRLRCVNPLEALRDDALLRARYIVGTFEQKPLPVDIVETTPDGIKISADQIARIKYMAENENRHHFVVLPKPTAAALLVAITGFPRRGDIYKDGTSQYAANLLACLGEMITQAECRRSQHRQSEPLPPTLRAAHGVLLDNAVPFESRRPIAAEYVTSWADSVCRRFTFYARLATFDYFGELGSSLSTVTAYFHLPQLHEARLPDVTAFSGIL